MDDIERRLDRLKKLVALSQNNPNPHEAALAARKAFEYLATNPIPVRWFVRRGTHCHVVPSAAFDKDLTAAGRAMKRNVPMRKDNWFLESQRVRNESVASEALGLGFFVFTRYGYTVFVPASAVEVYV